MFVTWTQYDGRDPRQLSWRAMLANPTKANRKKARVFITVPRATIASLRDREFSTLIGQFSQRISIISAPLVERLNRSKAKIRDQSQPIGLGAAPGNFVGNGRFPQSNNPTDHRHGGNPWCALNGIPRQLSGAYDYCVNLDVFHRGPGRTKSSRRNGRDEWKAVAWKVGGSKAPTRIGGR